MKNLQIEIFNTIVETKSFNKAANVMGIEYSKVKYQIDQLEKEFNTEFFTRSVNGCRLTDAGKRFYEYSTHLAKEYYKMINEFGQLRNLTVGFDMSCPPDSLLQATKDICEKKKIECKTVGYDADYLLTALEKGEIDCIYNYEFEVSKLINTEVVIKDHMVVVIDKNCPFYYKEKIDISDLLFVKIYFKHYDTRGSKKMTKMLEMFSSDFNIFYGVSLETVKDEIKAGRGVMIVPFNFWKHYMNEFESRDFRSPVTINYFIYSYQKADILKKTVKEIIIHFNHNYER